MATPPAKPSLIDRLWALDPTTVGGWRGAGISILQFLTFVSGNFLSNQALMRASALSFTSLLSLVPLLALAFSVLKGLGAQNKLAPLIIKQMSAGSEVVVNRVITYIDNTNMSSVGAIGLAALLYTSITMLSSIEEAFNEVWGVSETRSLYRKFSDYLSVLVSAPILILAATSITTSLHSKRLLAWLTENTYFGDLFLFLLSLTPYVTIWLALLLLYLFVPNTRVRYPSALIGAVLAGTMWELAQWIYIKFQVGAGNYNAIYGTLAALPILMIWIYVSWLIVLFGMEVVAAHQNRRTFRRELRGGEATQSLREAVALAALRHIAEAFHAGEPGWSEERLAIKLAMPLRVVRETLRRLVEAGFIVQVGGRRGTFYPARELDAIALSEVLLSLRGHGAACYLRDEEQAAQVLETVDRAVAEALAGRTMKELAGGEKTPPVVDKGGPVDI